jgi:hypothetical protein
MSLTKMFPHSAISMGGSTPMPQKWSSPANKDHRIRPRVYFAQPASSRASFLFPLPSFGGLTFLFPHLQQEEINAERKDGQPKILNEREKKKQQQADEVGGKYQVLRSKVKEGTEEREARTGEAMTTSDRRDPQKTRKKRKELKRLD